MSDSRPARGSDGANKSGDVSENALESTWRNNEFQTAPTPEQLRKIHAEEQQARDDKAQAGQHRVSVADAAKSIKAEDFITFHKAPCSREGLLTAIGGGGALGALRYVFGRGSLGNSANWAVGGFATAAVVSYEFCQYRRRKERENMRRVVEVQEKRNAEKRIELAKKAQEAREEAARQEEQKKNIKAWYRFW